MRPASLSVLLGFALLLPAPRAHAASREIIQLQTQVQALSDMLQALQRSNSEQLGVLQHLVEQSNDNVGRMSQQMTALQAKVDAEGQNNPLSGQIQSLNDSVDELKTRLSRIDTTLNGLQGQLGNVNAPAAGSVGTAPTPAPAGGGGTSVPLSPPPASSAGPGPSASSTNPQAPPADQLFQSAVRDYNGAKYDLATSEFADVVKFYPQSPEAGNASFYLGEVAYRQQLYPAAIRNYDIVLEQYAGSPKAPPAQLRKGEAELASSQRDAGIRDLRALVQRYPASPESTQARSLLNGMGVRLTASKPSPGRLP